MRLCWEVWIQVLFCEGASWEETVPVLTQDWVLDPWARSPAGLRSVGTRWEVERVGIVRRASGVEASLPSGREAGAVAV